MFVMLVQVFLLVVVSRLAPTHPPDKHANHYQKRPEGGFTVAVYLPGMPQQGEPDEDEKRRQAFQDAF